MFEVLEDRAESDWNGLVEAKSASCSKNSGEGEKEDVAADEGKMERVMDERYYDHV